MSHSRTADRIAIISAAIVFSALSVWMAIASKGFLEADGITHYLARRFALHEPVHMVGIWNRPLCVMLYCVPANFGGLIGTRLMSLALVLVMLYITLALTRYLKVAKPALVGLFLLTQPLLFAHSFSELTEIPFALLLIAMMGAYATRSFGVLALLAAISPLARPEGFGLLLVVGAALIIHRKWIWLLMLPLGLLFWSYAGWLVFGSPAEYPWYAWLKNNWPYSADSTYGHDKSMWKKPLWFVVILPAIIGPMAFPMVWIGVKRLFGGTWASWTNAIMWDHRIRCRVLLVIVPLGALVGHSILWTFGKMASNGEPRYMLIVAPFWAILAAVGWERVCEICRIKHPLRWVAISGLLVVAINWKVWTVFPLGLQDDDRLASDIGAWLDEQKDIQQTHPRFAAALPHMFFQQDLDRLNRKKVVDSSRTLAANPPTGVVLVWDSIYSTHNSNVEYCIEQSDLESNGWRAIHEFKIKDHVAKVYLSPQPATATTDPVH